MKRNSILLSMILTLFLIASAILAQTPIAKDYKGNYQLATIFSGTDVFEADTSNVFEIPYDVKQGVFYLTVNTCSTDDTLKTMYIQASPDGSTGWVNTTYTFADVTSAGNQRVAATLIDKYIRFIFAVQGTNIAHDFTVKFIPK